MSDLLADLAALEASSATAMTTAPAALDVHMPEPVPGTVTNVTLGFDGQPIGQTQTSTQDGALQPYPTFQAPVEQPAPSPEVPFAQHAEVIIPEKTPRRVYSHEGMHADNKLLLGLIEANPSLSMDAIMAAANTQLGRTMTPVAAAPALAPATAAAVAPSFDTVNTRLDEIDTTLGDLDPVVDAEQWKQLTLEHNKLSRQLPSLQVQQVQQQMTVDQQVDAQITETRTSVSSAYPQISPAVFAIIEDPSQPLSRITDPFAQAFAARYRQDQAAESPLLNAPDYESLVAASLAQQHGILPAQHAARQPVAMTPGAPVPAQPAAPQPRAAQPTMQQPGLVPVAAMPAISGVQHTSADRVTTQPANPLANLNAEYQQAVAAGDFEGIERLSGIMASGGHQPQSAYPGGILGISYS